MDIPWFGWIVIIGAIGWAAMGIIRATRWGRSKGGTEKDVMEQNIATNKAVLDKLDSIETRLAVVEKTLTDIP